MNEIIERNELELEKRNINNVNDISDLFYGC